MKFLIKYALLASVAISPVAAKADVYALVLGEKLPDYKSAAQIVGAIYKDTLKNNGGFIVFDGHDRRLIGESTIPDKPRYGRSRNRLKHSKALFLELKDYLELNEGRGSNASAKPETRRTLAFGEFSELMHSIKPNEQIHVLMFGRAVEHDPAQVEFSMHDEMIANDAHFSVNSFVTPYGTADRQNAHKNITYHWCYTDAAFSTELIKKTYARFWSHYLEHQKGKLATFTSDQKACLTRYLGGHQSDYSTPLNAAHTKPEMIKIVPETIPEPPQPEEPIEVPVATVEPEELHQPPVAAVEPEEPITPELKKAIENETVKFLRLRLYDNEDEDGDVVRLKAPGFEEIIVLTNRGVTLNVPLVHGAMILHGLEDGGGGITVSVSLPDGTHLIDGKMAVGEEFSLVIPQ